jgi:hypothetical protein
MRYKPLLLLLFVLSVLSCRKDKNNGGSSTPPPPPPPAPAVFLKEIVVSNLPSPYYHFDFTGNKVSFVSFASGFGMYDVIYSNNRISEMKNNIVINKDRLVYSYNSAGKTDMIRYIDSAGNFYRSCSLSYTAQSLTKITWQRKLPAGFTTERTLSFTYHPDGNVKDITDHRLPINGMPELIFVKSFSLYDNKLNTDGFTLIHDENNDHLFLLPEMQLQKNNPGKLTRTGSGLSYEITYTYTYNDKNAPLTKTGNGVITGGVSAGQTFQTNSAMTYY